MNNGKAILEAQEEPESIELLAAQRQLYTEAKRWKAAQVAISLAAPLAVTAAQVLGTIAVNATWCVIAEVFLATVPLALSGKKKGKRISAAKIQQAFDARVYGLRFANVEHDPALARSEASKYLERHGASKLRNWYTCVTEDMGAGEAISKCQLMNSSWAKRLTGRYCLVAILLPTALLAAIAVAVLATGTDIMSLAFLFSIVEWIALTTHDSLRSFRAYGKLDEAARSYSLVSAENIRRVQGFLYEARTSDLLVPDWFYNAFRQSDERATMFL